MINMYLHAQPGFIIMVSIDHLRGKPDDAEHQFATITLENGGETIHVVGKAGETQKFADMLQRAASNLQRRINFRKAKEL